MASFISPTMREATGRHLARSVSFPIAASDIRRWAVAIYHPAEPPHRFWDEERATRSFAAGIVAPEDFNPFAWMVAEPPGMKPSYDSAGPTFEAKLGIDEVSTSYMLNGGMSVSYGVAMRPGDVITSTTVLSGYRERTGRLGLMLFTETTTSWCNQRDESVKVATNTLIRY